jgi:hypothetical protein
MNDDLVKNTAKIEVVSVNENEDGSMSVTFDMDQESVIAFAKIGLLKVLIDSAKDVLGEEVDDNVGC